MDVATAGGPVQRLNAACEVGVGTVEFALFHHLNPVVGCSAEPVFDGLAAGLVAEGQALSAVFDKLAVFGVVIGSRC